MGVVLRMAGHLGVHLRAARAATMCYCHLHAHKQLTLNAEVAYPAGARGMYRTRVICACTYVRTMYVPD